MIKLMGGIRKMANSMYEEQKSEERSRRIPVPASLVRDSLNPNPGLLA